MSATMSILFYAKISRTTIRKTIPIYLRVTIEGKRMEVTTNRFVFPNQWSSKMGRVKGNSKESDEINTYLDYLKHKLYQFEQDLIREEKEFNIENLRAKWFAIGENKHTLMEAIGIHNEEIKCLVGKDFKRSTWVKYKTTERHVQDYIHWKFDCIDLLLKDLNIEFIKALEYYLQFIKGLSINSRGKILKNLKKIVADCTDKDWLLKDPFHRFHVKHVDAKVPHLSADELHRIEKKEFGIERLSRVKDLFIFGCYTGFAYIDMANLTLEHIKIGHDGLRWLIKDRQKTDMSERVPLLSPVEKIIEKYRNHPEAIEKGKLLPVPSNQKLNAYLKELADVCGIKIRLTFHIARHTFATTVTLDNGVPMESVSQMLGHKFIKTTQVYAKVSDKRITNDMEAVIKKYAEGYI